MSKFLWGVAIGTLVIFALKYGIVGLRTWDTVLHPERLQVDLSGPYKNFSEPFLAGWFAGAKV